MASARAPKQWELTKNETVNSVENWKQNLLYILSLDTNFAPFLKPGFEWKKKSTAHPTRGLVDDGDNVPESQRWTGAKKNAALELMLGIIANYCCVISRNSITKQSVSLDDIWRKIREHYGFPSTGSHFLELANITLLPNERHEDLYQCIMAFFEDNLLTSNGNLTHHGESIDTDKDLSPTLENTIVVLWLKTIHPGLPQLVKQRYGPELRNKTVASLKPEISLAMSSLLDELKSIEENRVLRAATPFPTRPRSSHPKRTVKSCILCKTANRSGVAPHFLSKYPFLPEADRRFMGRTRLIPGDDDDNFDDPECDFTEDEECALLDTPSARRVAIVQSPYIINIL